MEFPEPVIAQAVEPKTKADQEKMGIALQRLASEDPSFRVRTDEESGQTIISGMGELHLEIIVDRMKREFGVEANVGKPQVAYRETIRKQAADVEGKFVRQSGGKGQYGHVVFTVEPNEPGKGFEFVDAIKGGVVPREYIPAVQKGVEETLPNGVLAGYPVVDVKVTLTFGSYHEVDSSEQAFKMAASIGFKEACKRASPVILEPPQRPAKNVRKLVLRVKGSPPAARIAVLFSPGWPGQETAPALAAPVSTAATSGTLPSRIGDLEKALRQLQGTNRQSCQF